jgi:hypothetical protein
MTCRQATELDHALERFGLTAKHVKMMCSGDVLVRFKKVLDGFAEIKPIYEIDFDKAPYIPDGWTLLPDNEQLRNRIHGKMKFDSTKINLYLDAAQKRGRYIEGNELRDRLTNMPVFGVQLRDFYLEYPHFIPEEWKGKAIYFWGSIYQDSNGDLYVPCLCWRDLRWCSGFDWLNRIWRNNNPSIILAS